MEIVSDNRIPALATDKSNYTFALPAESGDLEIRARVIYRRSWRALVDGKDWHYDGHGDPLEDIAPPHFGHLMASAEETLSNGSPRPDGGVPDAGTTRDAGTGGGNTSGCAVNQASPPLPSLLALLLLLATLRRKRGQSPFSKG